MLNKIPVQLILLVRLGPVSVMHFIFAARTTHNSACRAACRHIVVWDATYPLRWPERAQYGEKTTCRIPNLCSTAPQFGHKPNALTYAHMRHLTHIICSRDCALESRIVCQRPDPLCRRHRQNLDTDRNRKPHDTTLVSQSTLKTERLKFQTELSGVLNMLHPSTTRL